MEEPIRILHVFGQLNRGGAEAMIMNLYRNIDRSNIQFDFVVHSNQQQEYIPEIIKLGGRVFYFPKFKGFNIIQIKKYWKNFFCQHPEYKILHSHIRSYASLYLPIAKKYKVKTIIHSHSTSNGTGIKSLLKWLLQLRLRYQADYFFACSNNAGTWLFGNEIVKSNRFSILKNAIDTKKFAFNENIRKKIRDEFNIKNELLVGTIGRLTTPKNPFGTIEIIKGLKQKGIDFKFIWVGTGDLEEKIKQKIKEQELEEYVIMTGIRSDVENIMQAMDIFILPSFWEGLPVVGIEAQAAGLRCLISDKVSKELQITDLVDFLSIENLNIWVEKINSLSVSRQNVSEQIKSSGFCVRSTASWITNFYIKIKN